MCILGLELGSSDFGINCFYPLSHHHDSSYNALVLGKALPTQGCGRISWLLPTRCQQTHIPWKDNLKSLQIVFCPSWRLFTWVILSCGSLGWDIIFPMQSFLVQVGRTDQLTIFGTQPQSNNTEHSSVLSSPPDRLPRMLLEGHLTIYLIKEAIRK